MSGLVLMTMVDNAGVARGKLVPDRGGAIRAGLSPTLNRYLVDDQVSDSDHDIGPVGEMRLQADAAARRPLLDGVDWAPADQQELDGRPRASCQRGFARRMAGLAAAAGLEVRAGIEIEWTVLSDQDGERRPRFDGPAYGAATVLSAGAYLADVAARLERAGDPVAQLHAEYAPGQFELSLGPADPVTAADRAVFARQVIRTAAADHGARASFHPILDAAAVGNGAHLTISVARDGRSLLHMPAGELTEDGHGLLGGLLDHIDALTAIGCGLGASFGRLRPGRWACAHACWGPENREAALRATGDQGDPAAPRVELKFPDASANPYLLIGAAIAAILDGLAERAQAPAPVHEEPARMSPPPPRLPASITAATDRLQADAAICAALGPDLCRSLLQTRRGEARRAAALTPAEDVDQTMWRL